MSQTKPLLIVKTASTMQPLLVVLDLDETLVHASRKHLGHAPDFRAGQYFVYKRPFLDEFLQQLSESFPFAIWSSATRDYVLEIAEQILPEKAVPEFIWAREKCSIRATPNIDEYGYYNMDTGQSPYFYSKQFQRIKRLGFSLRRSLMIEDSPEKIANSYGNAIYVSEFNGQKGQDIELLCLIEYLKTFELTENVRTVEKRGWIDQYKMR